MIKVNKARSDGAHLKKFQATESRLFTFSDQTPRLIMLKKTVWEKMDWLVANDVLSEVRILDLVLRLVQGTDPSPTEMEPFIRWCMEDVITDAYAMELAGNDTIAVSS